MKTTLSQYFIRLIISLIITFMVFLLLLHCTNKYTAHFISKKYSPFSTITSYKDLDNDGNSEEIGYYNNKKENYFGLYVLSNGKIIEQWSFKGESALGSTPFFSDYDNDRSKEILLLGQINDSVFLYIIDGINKKTELEKFFITKIYKIDDYYDYSIKLVYAGDVNNDSYKELFFFTSAAYSTRPRRVFAYYPLKDTVYSSPESYAAISDIKIKDIDKDSIPEFILSTIALGNCEKEVPYSDMYSWLMVLDSKMQFKFSPVRFDEYPCATSVISINSGNTKKLLVLHNYRGNGKIQSFAALYDNNGKLLKRRAINQYNTQLNYIMPTIDDKEEQVEFFVKNNVLMSTDSTLKFTKIKKFENIDPAIIKKRDIDLDGEKEIILRKKDLSGIIIYRKDFSNPVELNLGNCKGAYYLSIIKKNGKPQALVFDTNLFAFRFKYELSFLHKYKYVVFVLILFCVQLIYFLIIKIKKYQKLKSQNIQKRIAELQIQSIQNQINPNFTYEIISTFENLMNEKDSRHANYLFDIYMGLLKNILINAEQIQVSLAQELAFAESYLEIEKFRNLHNFNYSINFEKSVNKQISVPRMLLHISIVHILKNIHKNTTNRFLTIKGTQKNDTVKILITQTNSKMINHFNHKIETIDQILKYYKNLFKTEIKYAIKTNENNITDIEIKIPVI